ncbi:MAG: hypothetical protein MN733_17625 [Nitrososphaera sp.]|nr:hypothetical protein [Nitrososphaera sp.]
MSSEYELRKRYREALDEAWGDVIIAGYSYPTSRALEILDPIAFDTGYNDWLDAEGLYEEDGDN